MRKKENAKSSNVVMGVVQPLHGEGNPTTYHTRGHVEKKKKKPTLRWCVWARIGPNGEAKWA